jgi:hypothetical protein
MHYESHGEQLPFNPVDEGCSNCAAVQRFDRICEKPAMALQGVRFS